MKKNISSEEANNLRKTLQVKIFKLLRERNISKLDLKYDEDDPNLAIYIMHYHPRFDSWKELRVTAIGIAKDGKMYLEAYDDVEGDYYTIYAEDMASYNNNLEWFIGLRDKMKSSLNIPNTTFENYYCEYADIAERLHQVELEMFHFMKQILIENGKISLGLSQEEEQEIGNFPITTTLYGSGRDDTPRIRLTDVYFEGEDIYADGIDDNTGEKRTDILVYSEQYADVFQFIGHCI